MPPDESLVGHWHLDWIEYAGEEQRRDFPTQIELECYYSHEGECYEWCAIYEHAGLHIKSPNEATRWYFYALYDCDPASSNYQSLGELPITLEREGELLLFWRENDWQPSSECEIGTDSLRCADVDGTVRMYRPATDCGMYFAP